MIKSGNHHPIGRGNSAIGKRAKTQMCGNE